MAAASSEEHGRRAIDPLEKDDRRGALSCWGRHGEGGDNNMHKNNNNALAVV